MGGLLRWNGFKTYEGTVINAGELLTVIFIVLVTVMSLATAGQNIPAISGAKVAGKMAFDIIDHVPGVQSDEKGSMVVKREEMKGKIEFEKVCFNYPSNPDLKVLKDLTITFEAGQTIGLIGPSGSGKSTII
jgi:ATP-binding cassette subfamily B (MDR/TAP) protein 1